MISFPFSLILIPYGLTVIFFAVMALVNVFHLAHYGATTGISFLVTFLFLAGAIFIFFFTWQELHIVNWNHVFTFTLPFVTKIPTL